MSSFRLRTFIPEGLVLDAIVPRLFGKRAREFSLDFAPPQWFDREPLSWKAGTERL